MFRTFGRHCHRGAKERDELVNLHLQLITCFRFVRTGSINRLEVPPQRRLQEGSTVEHAELTESTALNAFHRCGSTEQLAGGRLNDR